MNLKPLLKVFLLLELCFLSSSSSSSYFPVRLLADTVGGGAGVRHTCLRPAPLQIRIRGGNSLDQGAVEGQGGSPWEQMKCYFDIVGMNYSDFGVWEKRVSSTGEIMYYDSFWNRTQIEPPIWHTREEWQMWTQAEKAKKMAEIIEKSEEQKFQARLAAQQKAQDSDSDPQQEMESLWQSPQINRAFAELKSDLLTAGVDLDAVPNDDERVKKCAPELKSAEYDEIFEKRRENMTLEGWGKAEGVPLLKEADWEDGFNGVNFTEAEWKKVFVGEAAELLWGKDDEIKKQEDVAEFTKTLDAYMKQIDRVEDSDEEAIQAKEKIRDAVASVKEVLANAPDFFECGQQPKADHHAEKIIGNLPKGASNTYKTLRLVAACQKHMKEEGGAQFSSPMSYGVDPLYDKIDFVQHRNKEGNFVAKYVGDGVPGGYRSRHPI